MPPARVVAVAPGSPAAAAGVLAGDELLDAQRRGCCATSSGTRCRSTSPSSSSSCGAEAWSQVAVVEKAAGRAARPRARTSAVFDRVRTCDNHCPFCFIYQLPQGHAAQPVPEGRRLPAVVPLRELHHAHPLHRGRPRAGRHRGARPALREHPRDRPRGAHAGCCATGAAPRACAGSSALLDAGVEVHGQIVVCPGVNDGDVLDDTLLGILDRFPRARDGRRGAARRERTTPRSPRCVRTRAPRPSAVLDTSRRGRTRYLAALGRRIVFAADEYYLHGRIVRSRRSTHYEGLAQHENGIGMARARSRPRCDAALAGAVAEVMGPRSRVLRVGRRRAAEGYRAAVARSAADGAVPVRSHVAVSTTPARSPDHASSPGDVRRARVLAPLRAGARRARRAGVPVDVRPVREPVLRRQHRRHRPADRRRRRPARSPVSTPATASCCPTSCSRTTASSTAPRSPTCPARSRSSPPTAPHSSRALRGELAADQLARDVDVSAPPAPSSPSSGGRTSASRRWSTASSAAATRSSRSSRASPATARSSSPSGTAATFLVVDTGGWLATDERRSPSRSASRPSARSARPTSSCSWSTSPSASPRRTPRSPASCSGPSTPVLLVANKVDDDRRENDVWGFAKLGLGDPHAVSAIHGRGSGDLLDAVVVALPAGVPERAEPEPTTARSRSRSSAGRTSASRRCSTGSSATSARSCTTCPAPPATRSTRSSRPTTARCGSSTPRACGAGAGSTSRPSTTRCVRALDAVDRADAALLVIDATEGVSHQDQRLGERDRRRRHRDRRSSSTSGTSLDAEDREQIKIDVADRLGFLGYAPVLTDLGAHRPQDADTCCRRCAETERRTTRGSRPRRSTG